MVATAKRTAGKRQGQEAAPVGDLRGGGRSDPRTMPGACVRTPGGLRAYVEGVDPKDGGRVLISYESKSLGSDSYQPSNLTLVQPSPDQPTAAQAAVVSESKPDAERVLEAHKPEVVSAFQVGDRVLIQAQQNRYNNGRQATVIRVNRRSQSLTLQIDGRPLHNTASYKFQDVALLDAEPTAIAPTQNSKLKTQNSDCLADLATQINELHSQGNEAEDTAIAAGKAALQLRKEEGDRLLEAKAQLKHGQWGKWLKANCPAISERSCQVYMQLAEGWEHVEKSATAADLTLREAIALLPKQTKPAAPTPTPSALEYTPLPAPRPVWFKVGDRWTEGQAIAQNGNGLIRIVWGENRESDIPGWRVEWSKPLEQESAVSAETRAGLAAAGLDICKPSITPTEFNRELWGDKPPAVSYDWAKDGNEGTCKSFTAGNLLLPAPAVLPEPETPIVRLKVKRRGVGVEILGAIVQLNGITHYLQLEDLTLEAF